MDEQLKVTGTVDITVTDEFGSVKQHVFVPNMVVSSGKNFIASRIASSTATEMGYMAIGTNSTATNATDVSIAEIARVALASATTTLNVISFSATFPPGTGTSATINEAGIFNAASTGTMLCRSVFTTVNKSSTDTLTINWNVTIN